MRIGDYIMNAWGVISSNNIVCYKLADELTRLRQCCVRTTIYNIYKNPRLSCVMRSLCMSVDEYQILQLYGQGKKVPNCWKKENPILLFGWAREWLVQWCIKHGHNGFYAIPAMIWLYNEEEKYWAMKLMITPYLYMRNTIEVQGFLQAQAERKSKGLKI